MNHDTLIFVASFLGTGAALSTALGLLWRRFRGVAHLLDDLLGEPARPGRSPVPGVMARLADLEGEHKNLQAEVTYLGDQIRALAAAAANRRIGDMTDG